MRTGRAAATVAVAIVIGSCVNDVAPPDVISPPTNVTVTLVGTSSARITWTAPPEAVYVDSYNVLRDDVKLMETTSTSYQDNNLLQGVTYKYRISANGQIGIPGQLSAETSTSAITIPDITPPVVSSTSPTAGTVGVSRTVDVAAVFSEPMDSATFTTATFLVKIPGGALVPGTVSYNRSTRTAQFTVTSQYPNSTTMTATITTGAKDVAGNRLASGFCVLVHDAGQRSSGRGVDVAARRRDGGVSQYCDFRDVQRGDGSQQRQRRDSVGEVDIERCRRRGQRGL